MSVSPYAYAIEVALMLLFPVVVVLAIPALPYLFARWAYHRIDAYTQTL